MKLLSESSKQMSRSVGWLPNGGFSLANCGPLMPRDARLYVRMRVLERAASEAEPEYGWVHPNPPNPPSGMGREGLEHHHF